MFWFLFVSVWVVCVYCGCSTFVMAALCLLVRWGLRWEVMRTTAALLALPLHAWGHGFACVSLWLITCPIYCLMMGGKQGLRDEWQSTAVNGGTVLALSTNELTSLILADQQPVLHSTWHSHTVGFRSFILLNQFFCMLLYFDSLNSYDVYLTKWDIIKTMIYKTIFCLVTLLSACRKINCLCLAIVTSSE